MLENRFGLLEFIWIFGPLSNVDKFPSDFSLILVVACSIWKISEKEELDSIVQKAFFEAAMSLLDRYLHILRIYSVRVVDGFGMCLRLLVCDRW